MIAISCYQYLRYDAGSWSSEANSRRRKVLRMQGKSWDRVPIDAQSVDAPLSLAAVFLVITVASEQAALAEVFSVLGGLDDLVKTVGFRDLSGRLSCVAGIGRDLW